MKTHRETPVSNLRHHIASVVANEKSYEVPGVCRRLGLADGTPDEAFSGKYRYVQSRLADLDTGRLLKVARGVLDTTHNGALVEAVAALEGLGKRPVTEITRRRLSEALNGVDLSGSLDLIEFLEPLFPLDELPSVFQNYSFERTLRDDIIQACIRNDDWSNAELLKHLGILTCSQHRLFRFLEKLVSPIVRQDEAAQLRLVDLVNGLISRDGYSLQKSGQVSGYPVFSVREMLAKGATPADSDLTQALEPFDEAGIHELWQKALKRRHDDPEGAITIARTLLERTCKHILDERAKDSELPYDKNTDLPKLWALCAEELNLAPSQHTEKIFKQILGSCQSVVNSIGTLRNQLGDSHGQGGKPVKPRPRHAQLVVNLAGTMATFLITTWLEHEAQDDGESIKGVPSRATLS